MNNDNAQVEERTEETPSLRLVWSVTQEGILSVKAGFKELAKFDLTEIFPHYQEAKVVEKALNIFGAKQHLSDKVAAMKGATPEEKAEVMTERFNQLKEGIWKVAGAIGKETVKAKVQAVRETGINGQPLTAEQLELLTKLGL